MTTHLNHAESTNRTEPTLAPNRANVLSRFRATWHQYVARHFAQCRPERRRVVPLTVNATARQVQPLEDRALLSTITPVFNVADGAAGSLRDAINQANSNGEDDVIQLAAGGWEIDLPNELSLQDNNNLTGDFDLTEAGQTIVFEGQGPDITIIDAGSNDRAFHLLGNVTAIFRNLTIQRGFARDNGFPRAPPDERTALGGAILSEGGNVVLENVALTNNTAFGANGQQGRDGRRAYGGAVAVFDATLTVTDSSLINNQARGGVGGSGLRGANGTAGGPAGEQGQDAGRGGEGYGGAIYGEDADVVVVNSTFTITMPRGAVAARAAMAERGLPAVTAVREPTAAMVAVHSAESSTSTLARSPQPTRTLTATPRSAVTREPAGEEATAAHRRAAVERLRREPLVVLARSAGELRAVPSRWLLATSHSHAAASSTATGRTAVSVARAARVPEAKVVAETAAAVAKAGRLREAVSSICEAI